MQMEMHGFFQCRYPFHQVQCSRGSKPHCRFYIRHEIRQPGVLRFQGADILAGVAPSVSGARLTNTDMADVDAGADQAQIRNGGKKSGKIVRLEPGGIFNEEQRGASYLSSWSSSFHAAAI